VKGFLKILGVVKKKGGGKGGTFRRRGDDIGVLLKVWSKTRALV